MKSKVITGILVFILFSLYYLSKYQLLPIRYWDEHDWVAKSIQGDYYTDIYNPIWDDYFCYDQPPVVGYVNRLFLEKKFRIFRHQNESFLDFLQRYNFSIVSRKSVPLYWESSSKETVQRTPQELAKTYGEEIEKTIQTIMTVRKYNAVLLALHISLIFLMMYAYFHRLIIAAIVAVFYGTNYFILYHPLLANSEGVFLILFNVTILLFLLVRDKKNILYTGIFALLSAFLFQTKINGIMVGMFIAIYFLWQRRWSKATLFVEFFLLFSLLVNPTLMHLDFLRRIYRYFEVRSIVEMSQIRDFPLAYIPNGWRFFQLFFDHFFFGKDATYYNISLPHSWIYFLLFLLWVVGIIRNWVKQRIMVVLFIWIFVITAVYLRLDWDRYWLHLTFFVYYFELSGIIFTLFTLWTMGGIKAMSKSLHFVSKCLFCLGALCEKAGKNLPQKWMGKL